MTDLDTLVSLHRVTTTVQQHAFEASMAQRVLEQIEREMGYPYLAILTRGGDDDTGLKPLALGSTGMTGSSLDADMAYVEAMCNNAPTGITHWVAETGSTALVDDVLKDRRYHGIRDDISSELCVPLRLGGKVLGVINTETPAPRAYTRRDQVFLEVVADVVSVALMRGKTRIAPDAAADLTTICAYCKRLRGAEGDWHEPERVLQEWLGIRLSHGICPGCFPGVLATLSN